MAEKEPNDEWIIFVGGGGGGDLVVVVVDAAAAAAVKLTKLNKVETEAAMAFFLNSLPLACILVVEKAKGREKRRRLS